MTETTTTEQTITVAIARRYWDDYTTRVDEPVGTIVRWLVKKCVVRLTPAEAAEVLSDADYYATMGRWDAEGIEDIVGSAKRAVVAIKKAQALAAGTYVPPTRTTKQEVAAHDNAYTKAELLAEMRKALKQHGLADKGWTAIVNTRMTSTYGICRYRERRIEVSWQIARLNDKAETMNTILHEVAHALAGGTAGHGDKWKAVCIDIGARPERCYDSQKVATPCKWVAVCTGCGVVCRRFRKRPTRDYSHWFHRTSSCSAPAGPHYLKVQQADATKGA